LVSEKRITLRLDQYKPLRDIVFEGLREAIITQALKPGERLMESELAAELGVSRTPIREAIHKLELEGFVYVLPRKGAFVAEISLKDIQEIYEIRTILEGLASSLAAVRATSEEIEEMERCLLRESNLLESEDINATVAEDVNLHNAIYRAARNERLVNTLNILREQIYRMRVASTALPGRKKKSLEMHRKIVEAISERKPDLARELAEKHMRFAQEAMIEHYKRGAAYQQQNGEDRRILIP